MDASRILEVILNFIAHWAGTTIPRIVSVFVGILICILIISAIWDGRIRIIGASFGLIVGGLLIAVAVDTRIIHFLAKISYINRIRIIMSTISFIVLVITIESIRRMRLQERYALLWVATGLIILMTAFLPQLLDFISLIFGTQYVTSVVGVIFTFLLLISFHFSIALSGYQRNQTKIAQRCAILEQRIDALSKILEKRQWSNIDNSSGEELEGFELRRAIALIPKKNIEEYSPKVRSFRGIEIAAGLIIGVTILGVFITGLSVPQAMVGDEVTHFYMMVEQSKNLSQPNFIAKIPTSWGKDEIRIYPHPFLWHYGAAIFYRLSGGSFIAIQAYHIMFLLQLLMVAYWLARRKNSYNKHAIILYLIVIASLPMILIFSVTFYQDVPMTAQALTSFYFLDRRRWVLASLFMILAIGFKVTAILFLPSFFILFVYRMIKNEKWGKVLLSLCLSGVILFSFIFTMGLAVKKYTQSEFYPYMKVRKVYKDALEFITSDKQTQKQSSTMKNRKPHRSDQVTPYEVHIIANHPGDLRRLENFVVYGGIIFWLLLALGFLGFLKKRFQKIENEKIANESSKWLFGVGGSFIVMTVLLLRSAPDARFFLPGIPFVLLPIVENVLSFPRQKILVAIIASLSILQAGHVLAKTHNLRKITPELKECIKFLKKNPPKHNRIFMYPEGNYRYFPSQHEWYMGYRLREFWHADNDKRLKMLNQYHIGAVVIKKYLIAKVGPKITNLGVYPTYFVKELENDGRFKKVFENAGVIIFEVPSLSLKN